MLPQHIAIPMSSINNGADGRPVLTFYAQLNDHTVVSSGVLIKAVKVRVQGDVWIKDTLGPYISLLYHKYTIIMRIVTFL